MAYVAFAETALSAPAPTIAPFAPVAPVAPATPETAPRRPRFSALEWSVVMLAARDRLSSLRAPGRISVALGSIFGNRTNPRLADPRLEALRKMAVLTWHHGYTVPSLAVRRFVAAGFSLDQYELLVDSIGLARERNTRKAI